MQNDKHTGGILITNSQLHLGVHNCLGYVSQKIFL